MSLIVSADPGDLEAYVVSAGRLDQELKRLGRWLLSVTADDHRAAGVAELAHELGTLAGRERTTSRWVAAVASAVARADRGRVAASVVDVYVEVAHPGPPSAGGLAGLRFLQRHGANPGVMAGAARALGPERLTGLAWSHPELVGPVAGFPVEARYAANRRLIVRTLAGTPDPGLADQLGAFLRDDPRTGRARQVLLFDPRGDGRVAEVFGDLRTAGSVAVVVPGASSDLTHFDEQLALPVGDLAARSGRSDSTGGVAAIAWLGYDPPDGAVADLAELGAVASDERARAGGAALARTIDGLDLRPDQQLTLVGHSYGSTTVGAALLLGVPADRVVVMGSPGVLVDRASDFGRPDTDFFVMAAPGDLIAHLGWFGADPSETDSGFTRLDVDGWGHSAYLASGSLAQRQLVRVLTGRGGE